MLAVRKVGNFLALTCESKDPYWNLDLELKLSTAGLKGTMSNTPPVTECSEREFWEKVISEQLVSVYY